MFKNALVSVSNKEGLVEFLRPLVNKGLRIVSTGGTAKHLKEYDLPVIDVSLQTGFPEVMDGRVKTLHPHIHMALLARDYEEDDLQILKLHGLMPFDLVIGNLYPFEEALKKELTLREQCEFIDVGGPSFLRAAAKSFERITVVCNPNDYKQVAQILNDNRLPNLEERKELAAKVFAHTSAYDAMIADYFFKPNSSRQEICLSGHHIAELRYGENPQQNASWYRRHGNSSGLHQAEIVQGKALSYNNILDLDAAISTLREFDEPCAVAVKHNNPCGVAISSTLDGAVVNALKADPVSVFGGIVALNGTVTEASAQALCTLFLECVIASDYTNEAMALFSKKKNLRILKWPNLAENKDQIEFKTICGGFLVQSIDRVENWSTQWKIIGDNPTEQIKKDLLLAWKVCAHLKSNAIALVSNGQTIGLGMGQVNRVDAVEQALQRAQKHHPQSSQIVLASDAFFPFPDSIDLAHSAGIKWIIQPGGSIKDEAVFTRAKELGLNLILTGVRHFRH